MDADAVSKSFVDFYYATFDRNRSELLPLYKDMSMLTFEANKFQGANAIVEKLTSLPFQRIIHKISTIDAQVSNPQVNSIIVTVTGQLAVDNETHALQFTQTFQLIPEGTSYFIFNDIFRFSYAGA